MLKQTILLFFLFSSLPPAATAADIWYEDNNLGRAGGAPSDFLRKFSHPESFARASQHIRVYMIRAKVMYKLDDIFLTTVFHPYLQRHGMSLAIDAGGATYSQMSGRVEVRGKELELYARLKRNGLRVDYVSMQSVLSKNPRIDGRKVEYPLNKRIDDIVSYARSVRAIYPQVQFGIIDALPSRGKEYREPYRLLSRAMAENGLSLSYIHLDIPFEIPNTQKRGVTWKDLRAVERYVEEELGIRFGYFATSKVGGRKSSKAFHDRVMAALDCYTGVDGTPSVFVIASWFPYPDTTVPENATGDDYPAMRTVLEFGNHLEYIEGNGALWDVDRSADALWQSLCIN